MSEKLELLKQALRICAPDGHFALAFSGGLDSRFLAHCAKIFSYAVHLLHISGPHVSAHESIHARHWAQANGFLFTQVHMDPLSAPLVAAGDKRRCYGCKHALFSKLLQETGHPLCDGSNASDGNAYRPGAQAARELGVLSPLAISGLDKNDIHRLAEQTGLDDPWQKARPCLLTRLPYGTQPNAVVLRSLDLGESAIRKCLEQARLPDVDFRLRLTSPDTLELHVLSADKPIFALLAWNELITAIAKESPDLPAPRLVFLQTLSGYYDSQAFPRAHVQHTERP